MRVIILAAVATFALGGTSFAASQAFVGQMGQKNQGFNVQLNQTSDSNSSATILQFNQDGSNGGHGHNALQVQLDSNNSAYTYQSSAYHDFNALTWQQGGQNNNAVTVQASDGLEGGGAGELGPNPLNSVILQVGDSNTAVNWQQIVSDHGTPIPAPTILTQPGTSINIAPPTYGPPTPTLTGSAANNHFDTGSAFAGAGGTNL